VEIDSVVALRACSDAANLASAASFIWRMRSHRSISQLTAAPMEPVETTSSKSLLPRLSCRWEEYALITPSTRGESRDFAVATAALASATLAAALARSQLCSKASSTSTFRVGSWKDVHHCLSIESGLAGSAAAAGRSSGGRSYSGHVVEHEAAASESSINR
jgi:hypothetical protein